MQQREVPADADLRARRAGAPRGSGRASCATIWSSISSTERTCACGMLARLQGDRIGRGDVLVHQQALHDARQPPGPRGRPSSSAAWLPASLRPIGVR